MASQLEGAMEIIYSDPILKTKQDETDKGPAGLAALS